MTPDNPGIDEEKAEEEIEDGEKRKDRLGTNLQLEANGGGGAKIDRGGSNPEVPGQLPRDTSRRRQAQQGIPRQQGNRARGDAEDVLDDRNRAEVSEEPENKEDKRRVREAAAS